MAFLTRMVITTLLDATEKEGLAAVFACWSSVISNVDIVTRVKMACVDIVANSDLQRPTYLKAHHTTPHSATVATAT